MRNACYSFAYLKFIACSGCLIFLISGSLSLKGQGLIHLNNDSVSAKKLFTESITDSLPNADSVFAEFENSQKQNLLSKEKRLLQLPAKPGFTKKSIIAHNGDSLHHKKVLSFSHGYIAYNYDYRSGIDTPFTSTDIRQQFINASADVTIAQKIPVRVNFAERNSNIPYFRDYTDVRVELNTAEFRRLRANQLQEQLNKVTEGMRDPQLLKQLDENKNSFNLMNNWAGSPAVIHKLLSCREKIIYLDEIVGDSVHKDSTLREPKAFITKYEKRKKQIEMARRRVDSLQREYVTVTKRIQRLQNMFSKNAGSADGVKIIQDTLLKMGIKDKRIAKLTGFLYGVRSFSAGKTNPSQSNLTVKNVNVTGLNYEYNYHNLYTALAAGKVDYRMRDFLGTAHKVNNQYLISGRLGYGNKDGAHLIFTAYTGQKQIFSSSMSSAAVPVSGISIEGQWVVNRNTRILAEIAQSSSPRWVSSSGKDSAKTSIPDLKDNSNKAYFIKINSYIPFTQTRVEGTYQQSGINFQNFTNYKVNAAMSSWAVKADQFFWKHHLHLTVSAKKNEFSNPLILQAYNSNTVFKTASVVFQKRYWPVISAGYIPSSQFTSINGQVYESRYQAMNINVNHSYSVGVARASTSFMYSRFFNQLRDSGFIYYNSQNYFFYQVFNFNTHTEIFNISHSQNGQYSLDILEGGISKKIGKGKTFGGGVKINHLGHEDVKLGLYGNGTVELGNLGVLSFRYEKTYLPTSGKQLIKNEWLNLGFIKSLNF